MFGVVVLLLLIIFGLLLFFPMPRIGLGDEIKGFPVKETSLTVWNWTTALAVSVTGIAQADPQYQEYIVLNVSLRNVASHEICFGTNDSFNQELQQAKTKNLFLEAVYEAPGMEQRPCLFIQKSTPSTLAGESRRRKNCIPSHRINQ